MKFINYIFYIVLFCGFCLPSNSNFYIDFVGVEFEIREIAFILLPLLNILCYSRKSIITNNISLKLYIFLFILFFITTELIKMTIYNLSFGEIIKSIRLSLPLLCSILILYVGIRSDATKVWHTLLISIGTSIILSFLSLIYELPIYNKIDSDTILIEADGRLANSNASFGLIALFLIYLDRNSWYNSRWIHQLIFILSTISLIFTFNRTYLFIFFCSYFFISFKKFQLKNLFKIILIPISIICLFIISYNYFETIKNQVDKRIFSIILQETSLKESAFENNREVVLNGVIDKIRNNYWIIGMPINKPIFTWYTPDGKVTDMTITDTSLINVLLRSGIFVFIFYMLIIIKLYTINTNIIFRYILLLSLLVSINIDSIYRHNSLFFLIILYFITQYNINNRKNILDNNFKINNAEQN